MRELVEHLKAAGGLGCNPDIIASTLELYAALVRRMCPFLIELSSQDGHFSPFLLDHMAEIANFGLHCPEAPTVKSAISFITEVSRQTETNILSMIARVGQTYIFSLLQVKAFPTIPNPLHILQGVTGNAGRTNLDQISDGLFAISKPNVQDFSTWLHRWLAERRKMTNSKESDIQRSNFIQQLLR